MENHCELKTFAFSYLNLISRRSQHIVEGLVPRSFNFLLRFGLSTFKWEGKPLTHLFHSCRSGASWTKVSGYKFISGTSLGSETTSHGSPYVVDVKLHCQKRCDELPACKAFCLYRLLTRAALCLNIGTQCVQNR